MGWPCIAVPQGSAHTPKENEKKTLLRNIKLGCKIVLIPMITYSPFIKHLYASKDNA
jgi:hypothetical protein